jgi:hypothetical protein
MAMTHETVEMEVIIENDNLKPSSAPVEIVQPKDATINRKSVFRRSTGNKNHSKKSQMSSSSSLHSLVSILKPTDADQRSVPNVSFGDKYSDMKPGVSKNSLSVNLNPSIGETSSYQMEGDESFRVPGGSFSTQTSTIGFRASFFSVLEKLGVWRSQDLYKAPSIPIEARLPPDRKTARSSITSLYFRTVYGGKYRHGVESSTNSIFDSNLLQSTMSVVVELECEKAYLIDKRPFVLSLFFIACFERPRSIYSCLLCL